MKDQPIFLDLLLEAHIGLERLPIPIFANTILCE